MSMTPATPSALQIILLDSISYIAEDARDQIVVSGSHGGSAAARYALPIRPRLVVFNDAGVGKDGAGIAGLTMLDEAEIAAVAVAHTSARIGEATDTWVAGIIAHVNQTAARLGLRPGARLQEAIMRLWPHAIERTVGQGDFSSQI